MSSTQQLKLMASNQVIQRHNDGIQASIAFARKLTVDADICDDVTSEERFFELVQSGNLVAADIMCVYISMGSTEEFDSSTVDDTLKSCVRFLLPIPIEKVDRDRASDNVTKSQCDVSRAISGDMRIYNDFCGVSTYALSRPPTVRELRDIHTRHGDDITAIRHEIRTSENSLMCLRCADVDCLLKTFVRQVAMDIKEGTQTEVAESWKRYLLFWISSAHYFSNYDIKGKDIVCTRATFDFERRIGNVFPDWKQSERASLVLDSARSCESIFSEEYTWKGGARGVSIHMNMWPFDIHSETSSELLLVSNQ
jgi:hypothetical protein